MGAKDGILSILEYFTCLAFYWLVTIGFHEFIHLKMLRFLGGNGYILMNPYGAYVHITQQITNPTDFWLVTLSGGVGVALAFFAIALWNTRDDEIEEFSAILPLAGMQLAYGIFEFLFLQRLSIQAYRYYGDLASAIGFAIPAFIVLFPLSVFSDRLKALDRFNVVITFIKHFKE